MQDDRSWVLTLSLGTGPGGQLAVLSEPGCRPMVRDLDPRAVSACKATIQSLLAPRGGLLLPGEEDEDRARERQACETLLNLVDGGAAPVSGLGLERVLNEPSELTYLAIDARNTVFRDLPWELLERCRPDGRVRVSRVPDRVTTPFPGGAYHIEVHLWLLDSGDQVSRRLAHHLERVISSLDRVCLRPFDWESLGVSQEGVFHVLHIVGHGTQAVDQVVLQLEADRRIATESAARWLEGHLGGLGLAVLDICEGGSGQVDPLDAPATRLIAAGVPACVAPRIPYGADASAEFATALYKSLAAGDSVPEAVHRGREALLRLAIGHPSCRWWNPVLNVSHPSLCQAPPPLRRRTSPLSLPVGRVEAEQVLFHAMDMAPAQGFLGIEHLSLALSRSTGPSPLLSAVCSSLEALGQQVLAYGLRAGDKWFPSPRVRSLLATLPPDFDLEAVLNRIVAVPWVFRQLPPRVYLPVVGLSPRTDGRNDTLPLDFFSPANASGGAELRLVLEVWGGPEDGRRIQLSPEGGSLGRWDPSPHESWEQEGLRSAKSTWLFQDSLATDRTVSRRHLHFTSSHIVTALGPTTLERAGTVRGIQGESVSLELGDVLRLGRLTQCVVQLEA